MLNERKKERKKESKEESKQQRKVDAKFSGGDPRGPKKKWPSGPIGDVSLFSAAPLAAFKANGIAPLSHLFLFFFFFFFFFFRLFLSPLGHLFQSSHFRDKKKDSHL